MNKKCKNRSVFILMALLLTGWIDSASAQITGDNERYRLAIYATGTQNDQTLPASLLTVVQNKTITKLTVEGDYQLIERSGEFLKEIQSEQKMQQSGEVADGQIAEIGAGYGAEKVCVVSVTIINKYLYIATRIVDVATKTSYESGDAEVNNYKDIPMLTKTLDGALSKMLSIAKRNPSPAKSVPSSQPPQNESPTKVINSAQPTPPEQPAQTIQSSLPKQRAETPRPIEVAPTVPTQSVTSQVSDNNSFRQSDNLTVAEAKAEAERAKAEAKAEAERAKAEAKAEASNFKVEFKSYKKQVIKEKGGFLGVSSLAYKEYRKYYGNMISGTVLLLTSVPLVVVGMYWDDYRSWHLDNFIRPMWSIGFVIMAVGTIQLCTLNNHLKKSYNYYLNGDQRTVSMQFYPYYGGNNTFGAGLSLRF